MRFRVVAAFLVCVLSVSLVTCVLAATIPTDEAAESVQSGSVSPVDGLSDTSHSTISSTPHSPLVSSSVEPTADSPTGADATGRLEIERPCPYGPGGEPPKPTGEPRIVELYPNPTTQGNVGEFFVLSVGDERALETGNWSVTDGHSTVRLPAVNVTASGRVAFSTAPNETASMTTYPVERLEGHLKLAAAGDDLALERDGRVVDRVSYDDAPLGELWHRGGDGGVWWPRGATCREVTTAAGGEATAFVLPDSPTVPLEEIRRATDRIALAGYTFTSEAVTGELRAAADRGVDVSVLLEGGPVGGMPDRTATVVDDLAAAGVSVRVLGGRGARYRYHHAKYAVVDDRALVTTENWKSSGIGGTSSRGWGVVVDGDAATDLERVFRADFEGRDTLAWADYRTEATFVESDPIGEPYGGDVAPETVPVDTTEVLLAPDNAEGRVLELLDSAEESILVEQVRIGGRNQPLLRATIEAARRGVDVRILLDASWYVEDENRALADWLERTADDQDLPLEVRLVDPRNRFEKIHAKGVVIDDERVVVGSLNWNNNSFRNNREVALVLHGDEIGSFYADVFEADWDGGSWSLPVSLLVVLVVGLLVATLVGWRYVSFGRDRDDGVDLGTPPPDRDGNDRDEDTHDVNGPDEDDGPADDH